MTRRTPLVVFLAATLAATGIGSLGDQSQGGGAFTKEDHGIESFDGTMLAATLYTPAGDGPFPAILMTHGFPGNRDRDYVKRPAERFASDGYLVLTYDSRGFGESRGETSLDGPNEVKDAQVMIDWLVANTNVLLDGPGDPRIGMHGECYAGGIQLLLAEVDPRIDALVPQTTWENLLQALFPNGVLKLQWTTLLFASGQGYTHGIETNQSTNPDHYHPDPEGAFAKLTEWYATAVATNDANAEMRDEIGVVRSTDASEVRAPTLFIQGWLDTLFDVTHTQNMYWTLRENGVPTKMVLAGIGHGYDKWDGWTADDPRQGYIDDLIDQWFAYFLKGDASARAGTLWPVERYEPWSREWTHEGGWPLARSAPETYFLKGTRQASAQGGSLESEPANGEAVVLANTGLPTSYTEVSYVQSRAPPDSPESNAPGTSVRFQTPPLEADLQLTGPVTVRLNVSTTAATDARLFLKLQDVDLAAMPGSGAETVDNLVTPVRFKNASPGVPVVQEVEVSLAPITYRFPAGHALAFTISTGDAAFSASREPSQIEISTTTANPSSLTVPVVDETLPPDPIPPQVTLYESNATVEAGTSYVFRVAATDNVAVDNVTVQGAVATLIQPEGEEFVVALEGLAVGRYEINVTAVDVAGASSLPATLNLTVVPGAGTEGGSGLGPFEGKPRIPSPSLVVAVFAVAVAAFVLGGRPPKFRNAP